MQEKWRSRFVVWAWTSCRVQVNFHVLSVARKWEQQHLLQWLQALGAQEMQWDQVLDKRPWLQTYTVPGKCMPLGRQQTTEGSPSWTWQAGGGSFHLLPRRHALSSRWLWTFTTTCVKTIWKNFKELLPVLSSNQLSFKTHSHLYSSCVQSAMLHTSETAIDKAKPPMSAAKWQGNDQTDLQCQAARHCHHQIQWVTCAAWHWGSWPHSEGEKALLLWTCGMLQLCSTDSLWHTGWWKAWAWEA